MSESVDRLYDKVAAAWSWRRWLRRPPLAEAIP
jgi:hypothetical protein